MSRDPLNYPLALNRVHLNVVIPAAGLSTRLGRAKQQLPVADTTLLGHTIATAIQFTDETPELLHQLPIVVSNSHPDSVPPNTYRKRIIQLNNPEPEHGILSTLRRTQTATENAHAVLVLLGDQYRVTSKALRTLFYAYLEAPDKPIAAQYHTVADQFNHSLSGLNMLNTEPENLDLPKQSLTDREAATADKPEMNLDDALLAPPMIWPRHFWHQLLNATHPRAGQTLLHTSAARALPMPEAAYDVDTEYDVFLLKQWVQRECSASE